MLNRKIIIPYCASDEDADVADFFSTFGIVPPSENTEDNSNEESPQDESQEESKPEETKSEGETENPQPQVEIKPQAKANEAFAQMRIENKKYQSMMKGIASLLGVNSDDPNAIVTSVQNAITQAQAKQQGIPPEMLDRMAKLEEANRTFMQNEIRKNAYLGFQKVKDKFSLDNNALNSFADGLVQEGLNPFEQQLDLETEYIKRNYAKIIADAEARGAEKEAKRAARASTHGTSPDNRQGGEDTQGVEKINTIGDLDKWFRNQSK